MACAGTAAASARNPSTLSSAEGQALRSPTALVQNLRAATDQ